MPDTGWFWAAATNIIRFIVSVLVCVLTWLYEKKSYIVSVFTWLFHNMALNHFIINILICWYLKTGGYGKFTVDMALGDSLANLAAAIALDKANGWFVSTDLGTAISGTIYTYVQIPAKWVLVNYISRPILSATEILWPEYNNCTTDRRCILMAMICIDVPKKTEVPLFISELVIVMVIIIFVIMVLYIKYLKTNVKIVKKMTNEIDEKDREIKDLKADLQECQDQYTALHRQHMDSTALHRQHTTRLVHDNSRVL